MKSSDPFLYVGGAFVVLAVMLMLARYFWG